MRAWETDDRERLALLATHDVAKRLCEDEAFRPTADTPPLRADALQLDRAQDLGKHTLELSGTLRWADRDRRLTIGIERTPSRLRVVGIRWGE